MYDFYFLRHFFVFKSGLKKASATLLAGDLGPAVDRSSKR